MDHKFGVHYIAVHGRPADRDYVAALQPKSIKFVNTLDVQRISDMHAAAPNALVVLRDHKLSEQHDAQRTAPAPTGKRHAAEWSTIVSGLQNEAKRRRLPFPSIDQLVLLGINEPQLEAPGLPLDQRIAYMREAAKALDLYTSTFLQEARRLGFTAGAFNMAGGQPTNWDFKEAPKPGARPDWGQFPETHAALVRTRGFLFLHEYWAGLGPGENWKWWAGRFLQCPWDVPIIIGEAGIDMLVKGAADDHKRGWQAVKSPEQYMADIRAYHEAALADSRIHSIQLYTTDYSAPWQSFDLAPVQPSIVAYARSITATPAAAWVGYVAAPDGLNLRAGPSTADSVIAGLPYGTKLTVWATAGDWLTVTIDGAKNGFVSRLWVSDKAPTNDLFDRAFSLVIGNEGIYSDDPQDSGNWSGNAVGVGELKGTKYGISAAAYPHLDIKNLSLEVAKAIYLRDYWIPSGAGALAWPMAYVHFDTAVLHGVGRANAWLTASGGNFAPYLGLRLIATTEADTWAVHGRGWARRIAGILALG